MAYKGLAKEKEALDASFKILSQKKKESGTSQSEQNQKNEDENVSSEENQFTDPLQAASKVMMKPHIYILLLFWLLVIVFCMHYIVPVMGTWSLCLEFLLCVYFLVMNVTFLCIIMYFINKLLIKHFTRLGFHSYTGLCMM